MVDETGWRLSVRDINVLILTLSLLGALAIPAIEYGRSASHKQTCANHLRQLGVALQSYHDQFGSLPPAATWSGEPLNLARFMKLPRPVDAVRENWVQMLLPFLDEEPLALQFDKSVALSNEANVIPRTTELPVMLCPSDPYNGSDNHHERVLLSGETAKFARGNYGINGGSHHFMDSPGWLTNPRINGCHFTADLETRSFQWWGDGVAGINRSFSFDDFENGRSTLVLLDELRAGVAPVDPRGVWSLGTIGGSITWAHGVNGDAFGPNATHVDADDVTGCRELHEQVGRPFLIKEGMTCCSHCDRSDQATSRSKHTGGVNVLLADGAVRFVGNHVSPSLWQVMHSRETPEGILDATDESSFNELVSKRENTEKHFDNEGGLAAGDGAQDVFTNSVGMSFTLLPAGGFMMGVPDKNNQWPYPDEVAVKHEVQLTSPFYCGTHEVTQKQFMEVMGYNPSWHANVPTMPGEPANQGEQSEQSGLDRPVENVTWDEANKFCRKLSARPEEIETGLRYRLLTEAEWEYGCRSGSSEPYPFNPNWDERAYQTGIIAGKAWTATPLPIMPVGSFPPNPFGLCDMRGNVYEWTADWFARDYYLWSSKKNPQGPATGYLKVVRGWDWRYVGTYCKNDYLATAPWKRSRFLGFRVVCERLPQTE